MHKRPFKILSILLCLSLLLQQTGFAQAVAQLDIASQLSALHSSFILDKFRPLHLRYLQYNPQENTFRLLLDKGDTKELSDSLLQDTSKTLLKYFLIGVTLPNDTFWVNLRPDSPDNIIDPSLEQTDIGRIMLETDLQLKKDTAGATSPQTPAGKEYWDKLYKKAEELFGSENITIPTLTRPWIVPDEIIVRETSDSVYVYKATLKVMLEQDYLAGDRVQGTGYSQYEFKDPRLKVLNEYSSQLIRELIIPKLTKEVNSAKRYASLRQVYYSLIMAQWFKARLAGKSGQYAGLINTKDLANLTCKKPYSKDTYFQEYQKSFKDGEYNIKESVYTPFGQVIRSYFSGGISDLSGGIGFQQALVAEGQSDDGSKMVTGGIGIPFVGPTVIMTEIDAESPDMAKMKVTHAQRNQELAGQFEQGTVVRISEDTITIEGTGSLQLSTQLRQVNERLNRIRAFGGTLEETAGNVEVASLAALLKISEAEARQKLIAIVQDTDILLVRNRLTLHEGGPFAHARRGVSGRGKAIWLGEKLFLLSGISDQNIALLLFEEAKHILAPHAGHDVIIHNRQLRDKLSAAAVAAGELLGEAICELDVMPLPEAKIFYLPEIIAPPLTFFAVKDYSSGEAAGVVGAVFEYLNTLYAEMNRQTGGDIRKLGGKEVEANPAIEEQGLSEEDVMLNSQIRVLQQRLWESLALLQPETRRELFGTETPGDFVQEAFDRIFLFSLPRYFASLGIFPAIEHVPLIHNDIITNNLYALDLYEIDKVEEPSVRWHRGAPVTCKQVPLGKRVSVGGKYLTSPIEGGFAGRSAYGVIVIEPKVVEGMARETKQQAQSNVFRQIASLPIALLLQAVNQGVLHPLAVNSAMLGVAASRYLRDKGDAELRQESLQVVEHHEIEHLIRQGKKMFRAPANEQSAAEFIAAYNNYAFHEELKARLAELLHMHPLQTLLVINSDIRSGTQGNGAWYGSGSHYIFQKIVEIVRKDPARYGFMVLPGYPVEPQLQAQIFTLVDNRKALLEIVTEIDRQHDEELKQLGLSDQEGSPDMDSAEASELERSAFGLVRSFGRMPAGGVLSPESSIPFDGELLKRMPQNPRKRELFVDSDTHRSGLVTAVIGRHLDGLSDKEAYEALTRIISMDPEAFEEQATLLIGSTNASSLQSYAVELLSWVYGEDALPVLLGYIERVHDVSTFSRKYLLEHAIELLSVEVIARDERLSRDIAKLLDEKMKILGGNSFPIKRFREELQEKQAQQKKPNFLQAIAEKTTDIFQGSAERDNSAGIMTTEPSPGADVSLSLQQKWQDYRAKQMAMRAQFANRRMIPRSELEECLIALEALNLFIDYYDHASIDAGNYGLIGRGEQLRGIGGISSAMSREHNLMGHFTQSIRDLFDEIFCAGTHRTDPIDSLVNPETVSNARRLMELLAQKNSFFRIVRHERANMAIGDDSSFLGLSGQGGPDTVNMHERARRIVVNSLKDHLIHQISDPTNTRYNRGWLSEKGMYIDEEAYAMIRGHLKALAAELEKVFGKAGSEFLREALAPALRVFGIDVVPSAETFGLDHEAAKILAIRRMPFNNGGGPDVYLGIGSEGENSAVYYGRAGRKTDGPIFVSEQGFDSAHKVVVTPDGRTPDIKSLRPSDKNAMFSAELAGEKMLREALDSDNPEALLARIFSAEIHNKPLPLSNEQAEEESPDFAPDPVSLINVPSATVSDPPANVDNLINTPSTPTATRKTGGIDFRNLPIVTKAITNLNVGMRVVPLARSSSLNLDSEWQEIEQLVSAGITPSGERIKEYLQASCYNGRVEKDKKQVVICISNILRMEEERYVTTDPVLRDILIVLESGSTARDLKTVFTGIKS